MAADQYDVSAAKRRLLEDKAKQRAILRQEYIKQITNPHRHATGEGGVIFDTGIQRFMSMTVSGYDHFKPTPRSTAWGLIIVAPIVLYAWWLKSSRDAQEKLYRTGQVSYRDRRFKFI
ncbi:NADH dehydrogenase [ubiquinone] 1 beta subcomplex subunit 4 [Anabrus simplex]|uniref:NADH dehydrogenase [ubiquinone] 1 beta subcomplex subunit 4 n=1 Tax=Anabrus simplex TaxID=316456 RepID=UPI0034DD9C7A